MATSPVSLVMRAARLPLTRQHSAPTLARTRQGAQLMPVAMEASVLAHLALPPCATRNTL